MRQLAACKTLEFKLERDTQSFKYRSVRYWSKEINGTPTGGRKNNFFNSRSGGGRGHRAAAPAESCQSLPKRSPWGRLGSVLYTRKRLRRIRRRFKHIFGQFSQDCNPIKHEFLGNGFQSPRRATIRRMRYRRLPTIRATPVGVRGPICPRKK